RRGLLPFPPVPDYFNSLAPLPLLELAIVTNCSLFPVLGISGAQRQEWLEVLPLLSNFRITLPAPFPAFPISFHFVPISISMNSSKIPILVLGLCFLGVHFPSRAHCPVSPLVAPCLRVPLELLFTS